MPVCPACTQSNPSRARFCMSCGATLPLEQPAAQAARKMVTIVFCDVAGSTAVGERLDPESLREVMTRFFRDMRAVLEHHGGTVEKFIGDAVMAVFGVPLIHEDDALRAVEAAHAMQAAVATLNADLEPRYGVALQIRIGVNTGEVVVGDASAGQALVVGDAVNTAARLEQAAGAGEVFLGQQTYSLVRQHVDVEPTEPLELKGKAHAVVAYRLRDVRPKDDAVGERPDPPLVGRVAELEALRTAFERAAERTMCVLRTVVGSAGVGKSRLAREFLAALPDDVDVLHGRCLPYGDGITFWPIVEIVKQACGITDDEARADAGAKIEAGLLGADDAAVVAERIASVTGFGDAGTGPQETFWAIRRFLEWRSRERPVVVVLDDLHWAEPTLLDLVEYLAGWTQHHPLFLLCLARPDLLDERPTWGSGLPEASSVALHPLDDRDTERFVAQFLGSGITPSVLERIEEAAGGNPLFLEEMLRMLEDDGVLRREDGRWVATRELHELTVPDSIQALLGARLDRLSVEERGVIRCAAVVGKSFWWGAVAELSQPDVRPRVGTHLHTLVRRDLIRPERSTVVGEDAFRFHHILIQEAAYLGTPKDARAELHERFADWIVSTAGDRVAEVEPLVGYHFEQAYRYRAELAAVGERERGLASRAAGWHARAAKRALDRRDSGAAADLLTRAVGLLEYDAPERPALLLDLTEVLAERGVLADAERTLDEVDAIADKAGDEALAAKAALLRLFLLDWMDPKRLTPGAIAEAERAIATLDAHSGDPWLARGWRLIGDLYQSRSRYGVAGDAYERAIAHARRAGDVREEADSLGKYAGSSVYGPAPATEIERRCNDLLERTTGGGFEAPALRGLAFVGAMRGRFDDARAMARRAQAILEDLGLALRAAWVSDTLGAIELLAGNAVAAEREYRAGYEAAERLGDHGYRATVGAFLAHALLEQGRDAEALALADLTASTAGEDDLASQVLWRGARARAIVSDDRTEASRLAREAVELADRTDDVNMQADALVDLGIVLDRSGTPDAAAESFVLALERYEAKGNRVAADRLRARTALGIG